MCFLVRRLQIDWKSWIILTHFFRSQYCQVLVKHRNVQRVAESIPSHFSRYVVLPSHKIMFMISELHWKRIFCLEFSLIIRVRLISKIKISKIGTFKASLTIATGNFLLFPKLYLEVLSIVTIKLSYFNFLKSYVLESSKKK